MKPWTHALARMLLAAGALAGAQAAGAVQVVVGHVGPHSGLEASGGRGYAAGLQLALNAANKAGGVNGHTFALAKRDDNGRPEDTVALTKALLAEDKPLVLAGFFGSRNVADLVASGVLEKEKIAVVGYRTTEVRSETPLLYNVRASTRDELQKLAGHLATIGITRIGFFYEEGAGSAAVLKAAEEVAATAKVTIVAKSSYPAGTARVTPAADAFLKAQPQAILMVSTGAAAAGLIEQYRAAGGAAQLFAHSGADIEQMAKRLSEEQMQGVAIAQVTPSPYKIATRLSKEFIDLVAKAPPEVPVSYPMMEGFIAGKVIVEAVRRQGAKPTREGLIAALDGMQSYDLGGYVVGFRPDMRSGSRFVELTIVSGAGRIRQ
jgi:branched-chain amino acid transport system substrate-binding protein